MTRGRPSAEKQQRFTALLYQFYAYPGDQMNPITVQCIRCRKPYTLRPGEDPAQVAEWMRQHVAEHTEA
jgi:hypothetical protein